MTDTQLTEIKSLDEPGLKSGYQTFTNMGEGGITNQSYVANNGSMQELSGKDTVPGEQTNGTSFDLEQIHLQTADKQHKNGGRKGRNTTSDEVEQYEESSDDDDEYHSKVAGCLVSARSAIGDSYSEHKTGIWRVIWLILASLYLAYFSYAMAEHFDKDDEGCIRLLWCTCLAFTFIIGSMMCNCCLGDKTIGSMFDSSESPSRQKIKTYVHWILILGTTVFIIAFLVIDVALEKPRQLISGLGMIVFIFLFFIFSKHPTKVEFRPVFWGLALQFYFALLILRTEPGFKAFEWLGDRIREFMAYTDTGSMFVFGADYEKHMFAFKVLTVIVFFSSSISVLYYLGVMQFVICYIARFLAWCLGTSPTESLNAAANIFVGQSESPLLIRPFIKDMTKSELHAVSTGGFATIAGSVLAAYIAMDVPANHLLSASVMSAPAALAMSKLFWPETKKSKARAEEVYDMPKGSETNVIEAASNGASVAISLIANIAVNLIAFLSFIKFFDSTLIWFGERAGLKEGDQLSFTFLCSYIFYPVSWLLGTPPEDVRKVAGLIGTKTFLNEFVAYADLSVYINNTNFYNNYMLNKTGINNGSTWEGDDLIINYYGETLKGGIMTDRGIVIATYALCGFSNVGSMGIMLGALGAMAPTRKKDITKVLLRALIAGNVACFMTACIAGLLYQENP
ncbi:hypothetical protein ACF0H5_013928 [Mactra antiquata]